MNLMSPYLSLLNSGIIGVCLPSDTTHFSHLNGTAPTFSYSPQFFLALCLSIQLIIVNIVYCSFGAFQNLQMPPPHQCGSSKRGNILSRAMQHLGIPLKPFLVVQSYLCLVPLSMKVDGNRQL